MCSEVTSVEFNFFFLQFPTIWEHVFERLFERKHALSDIPFLKLVTNEVRIRRVIVRACHLEMLCAE